MTLRRVFLFALALAGALQFTACSSDSSSTPAPPTEGVITVVREVSNGEFKIASETTIPDPKESLVITEYLDGTVDTMTLNEARTVAESQDPNDQQRARPARSAGLGYIGWFWLGSRMMGGRSSYYTPNSSAYVNDAAYRRSQSTTGSVMKTSARARGGFGSSSRTGGSSGSSSRSFGG